MHARHAACATNTATIPNAVLVVLRSVPSRSRARSRLSDALRRNGCNMLSALLLALGDPRTSVYAVPGFRRIIAATMSELATRQGLGLTNHERML